MTRSGAFPNRPAIWAVALWLLLAALPAAAQTCRQALVLALDVSLSVNSIDFALQRQGLADALLDARVMDAMISPDGPHVELAVFEWSGSFSQNLLIDWTVIDSPATLQAIAATLIEKPQTLRSGRTGLGAALEHARDMLLTRTHCTRLTMDISGDGQNNSGIAPQLVKDPIAALGITVNALVIEPDGPAFPVEGAEPVPLSVYFHRRVIAGPAAFVETIVGFKSYGDAMRRKLLRELQPYVAQHRQKGLHRWVFGDERRSQASVSGPISISSDRPTQTCRPPRPSKIGPLSRA